MLIFIVLLSYFETDNYYIAERTGSFYWTVIPDNYDANYLHGNRDVRRSFKLIVSKCYLAPTRYSFKKYPQFYRKWLFVSNGRIYNSDKIYATSDFVQQKFGIDRIIFENGITFEFDSFSHIFYQLHALIELKLYDEARIILKELKTVRIKMFGSWYYPYDDVYQNLINFFESRIP